MWLIFRIKVISWKRDLGVIEIDGYFVKMVKVNDNLYVDFCFQSL
jgi:hypothetical protein